MTTDSASTFWWSISRRQVAGLSIPWLLLLPFAVGCGSSPGSVSGTVTFRGEAVPSGTVTFILGSKTFQTEIVQGRYVLTDLPPGEASITVVRLDLSQPDPYEALNQIRRDKMHRKSTVDPGASFVTDVQQRDELQKKRHRLPYRYASPDTSNLRCQVGAGPHTFDIALQDDATR